MPAAGDAGGIGMFPAAAGIPQVGGQLPPGMSLPARGRILNFLGMGMPELAAIFLVAFLALGPSKSIEMARTTGKVLGDLQPSPAPSKSRIKTTIIIKNDPQFRQVATKQVCFPDTLGAWRCDVLR
jgi:Sec-independent protein translocase protein TatA